MMTIFLIAGEASGDLHGSILCDALHKENPDVKCIGWGGDQMKNSGVKLLHHFKDSAFMGIGQVLTNWRVIRQKFNSCKQHIMDSNPDAIIYIDHSGFNLRMAKWAKTKGFYNIYYISPQIWATREGRITTIKKVIDSMYVILPFEEKFYQKHNMNVTYNGHPLMKYISDQLTDPIVRNDSKVVLLPGSRKQEIEAILPVMLQAASHFNKLDFFVLASSTIQPSFYQSIIKDYPVNIIYDKTYHHIQSARLAIVTSGTATLETAIIGTPQIICYKSHWLFYQIVKRIIKVPFISLVNLIAGKEIVKELIQADFNVEKLKLEIQNLLDDLSKWDKMIVDYDQIHQQLGHHQVSQKNARSIIKELNDIIR